MPAFKSLIRGGVIFNSAKRIPEYHSSSWKISHLKSTIYIVMCAKVSNTNTSHITREYKKNSSTAQNEKSGWNKHFCQIRSSTFYTIEKLFNHQYTLDISQRRIMKLVNLIHDPIVRNMEIIQNHMTVGNTLRTILVNDCLSVSSSSIH